jgi:lipooligosaccharide transport system permease protein
MTELATQSDLERGVALAARARRWGAWYVAEHRFRVMRSYLQTMLFTGIGNPLIYLFAMGIGLASLVDANLGQGAVGGVDYLVFVGPALLCAAGITVATEEFTYPVLVSYKWNPIFFGMNASPLRPGQIINGMVISVVVRMLLTCLLYYVFLLLFGSVLDAAGWVTVPVAVLTGLAFGTVLMGYTSTLTDDTGQLAMVMRFLVLPMTLFSGTFFPLAQLPVFLQWIGWISPLWHGTELARVFSYGYSEPIWLTVMHVGYLVAMFVTGWVWARRVAVRRLAK